MTRSFFENEAQSVAFLRDIIGTATDGIFVINTAGVIQAINPAAADLFGYDIRELEGRNVSVLMPEPHRGAHDGYIANYLRTGHAKIIGIGREIEGKRKDGTLFPARLAVSEVFANEQHYFTGFIHDMSDVKEAEQRVMALNEELEQMVHMRTEELQDAINRLLTINKRLEHEVEERQLAQDALVHTQSDLRDALHKEKELNELKSRFISMASHEFRTPLTTILSSTALLKRYSEADQQEKREKHLQRITSSVKHLTGILNDFLSISKIEEGRIQINPVESNLITLCEEVQEDFEGLLKEDQQIVVTASVQEINVVTDKHVVKSVLLNLLSNASKYSPEGTTITMHCEDNGETVSVAIRDRGMGIPESEQKHLFTRFFRASNATNIQGTGLGLNIVTGYLNMLRGDITFESVQEQGSTFTVTFPKNLS